MTSASPAGGRRRGGTRHQEPPTTGAAAQDVEAPAEDVARAIALRLLTAAPRSRHELATKLAERGVPDDVAEAVLDRFEEVQLLDDTAYAEMLVRTRHRERGLARRALAQELRRKGIDPEIAEQALEQVDDDAELEAARDLAQRRVRASRGLDRDKRRRRLAGMLARKGYPPGVALRAVDEALADDESLADDDAPAVDDGDLELP